VSPPVAKTSSGPQRMEGDQKRNYVRTLFDAIADRYDLMNLIMTGGLLRYWHRVFRRQTGLKAGQRALDVCCGTADLALVMASQVGPTGSVVGIDFSPAMLAVGRRKVERSRWSQVVRLLEGDALQLPFADNTFDCAAIGFALRNVVDIDRVLAEMARVVRPGGRVVSLELSQPRSRLVSGPFWWYFTRVVPLLGKWAQWLLPGNQLAPYAWLPESLKGFPNQEQLAARFRAAGLEKVNFICLHGGVIALHVGTKPGTRS